METNKQLAIKAGGLVTSVGFNYESTCAAMRAGISGTKEGPIFDEESGDYIGVCKAYLPQWWEGRGKLVDLIVPAIWQCMNHAKGIPLNQIPLLLGVAHRDRPFRVEGLDKALLSEVETKLGIQLHPASIIIPQDQIFGVIALQHANGLIQQGAPACIVAGVDSFVQKDLAQTLIEKRRILTPSNSNGFIPGEAGCAVLVGPDDPSTTEALILGVGFGQESGTIESDKPLTGKGMTQAIRAALTNSGVSYFDIDFRMTDMNGEGYKFHEAHFAEGRIARKFDERGVNRDKFRDIWHPIEFIGEVGAAIVPCVSAWALHALTNDYNPGRFALFHFGNDDGKRAAVVVKLG